ncbi:MAG TPA: response regulator [Oscillatoriaceae cyanobacterium M33_DOE_052]|uniref:Response regulator n=1 Tax=Planktothricoides sp. SpSt-374 TaxID=2282167 RepID=A0A7C3ZLQ0_9CYAN|nr:response regulator [Oscillatoriaceae cyanobacterium M33_DOE_052]
MTKNQKKCKILVADDDPDDRFLLEDALTETKLADHLYFVEDGEQLMDYLHGRGKYTDRRSCPRPDLILLDLNMPKKDGWEALKEIKSDPHLRQIPIVVFTTSKAEEDIYRTYDLGVNSFISKPVSYEGLLNLVQKLGIYWFETVSLPNFKYHM